MLISKCMTPVLILTLGIWSFIRRKKTVADVDPAIAKANR